jgi:fucose permease
MACYLAFNFRRFGEVYKNSFSIIGYGYFRGAIIPLLYARIVDANKHELIASGLNSADALATAATNGYWILIPCYCIVLFFAIWGHKIKSWHKRDTN